MRCIKCAHCSQQYATSNGTDHVRSVWGCHTLRRRRSRRATLKAPEASKRVRTSPTAPRRALAGVMNTLFFAPFLRGISSPSGGSCRVSIDGAGGHGEEGRGPQGRDVLAASTPGCALRPPVLRPPRGIERSPRFPRYSRVIRTTRPISESTAAIRFYHDGAQHKR